AGTAQSRHGSLHRRKGQRRLPGGPCRAGSSRYAVASGQTSPDGGSTIARRWSIVSGIGAILLRRARDACDEGLSAVADLGFVFGPFRLLPAQRMLLQDGKPLPLGSRAFDLLALLVKRAGEVIANDELMAQVWPNLHVDEGSLRVHIAALRRTLGD